MFFLSTVYIATVTGSLLAMAYEHYNRKAIGYENDFIEDLPVTLIPLLNLYAGYISVSNTEYVVNSEIKKRNKIYSCKQCGKLSRKYQRELMEAKGKSGVRCPHCETGALTNNVEIYAWQDSHPDCTRLDKGGLFRHLKTMKEVERLNREISEIDSFRKYTGM